MRRENVYLENVYLVGVLSNALGESNLGYSDNRFGCGLASPWMMNITTSLLDYLVRVYSNLTHENCVILRVPDVVRPTSGKRSGTDYKTIFEKADTYSANIVFLMPTESFWRSFLASVKDTPSDLRIHAKQFLRYHNVLKTSARVEDHDHFKYSVELFYRELFFRGLITSPKVAFKMLLGITPTNHDYKITRFNFTVLESYRSRCDEIALLENPCSERKPKIPSGISLSIRKHYRKIKAGKYILALFFLRKKFPGHTARLFFFLIPFLDYFAYPNDKKGINYFGGGADKIPLNEDTESKVELTRDSRAAIDGACTICKIM